MEMGLVRRASCLFLATCVFLTGCNSIIYDGNLHFKSYEPMTVPMLADEVADKVDSSNRELDENRFDVEGTDAFFILPRGEDDPDKILDFKVLDYTDAGTFIYAYITEFKPAETRSVWSDEALGPYPRIGRVWGWERDMILPATIDMLEDSPAPMETVTTTAAANPDETLPPPPSVAISEVTEKRTEQDAQAGTQQEEPEEPATWASSSGGMIWGSGEPAGTSAAETETYTFDPGDTWWGTDPLSGATSAAAGSGSGPSASGRGSLESSSAAGGSETWFSVEGSTPARPVETTTAEATHRDDDLWWDTGESTGIGHVDWERIESEEAARQSSLDASLASERASSEQASREQQSREQAEEAARSTTDMSQWWESGGESAGEESLHFNESTGEEASSAAAGSSADLPAVKTVKVVTVLMAYNPNTRVYKVFYAQVTAREAQLKKDPDTGEANYELASTEVTLSANKLVKADQYFIYDNYHGYVYDRQGNELRKYSYYASLSGYCQLLKDRARRQLAAAKVSEDEINARILGGELTISNVVMDGSYYVYFPIMFQLGDSAASREAEDAPDPSDDAGDDSMSEEEEAALESDVFQTVMVSVELDIGGTDPDVQFYSENTAWAAQQRSWLSHDKERIPMGVDAEEYMKPYSMENIKTSIVPDRFPAFHTEGGGLNLSLAYVPDIYSFEGKEVSDSVSYHGAFNVNIRDLFCNYDRFTSQYADTASLAESFTRDYGKKNDRGSMHKMFWSVPEWTDVIYAQALGSLALLTMGDLKMMKMWDPGMGSLCRLDIPWMTPGKWQPENGCNESPLPYEVKTPGTDGYRDSEKLEGILACRETTNTVNGERVTTRQFTPVIIPGRTLIGSTVQYSMTVAEETEPLKREFRQDVYVPYLDENGKEVKDENGNTVYDIKTETYTQEIGSMPLKYQFHFPEGTKLSWTIELATTEMAAPSGDMGVVLYEDEAQNADTETPPLSKVRLSNVASDLVKDGGIPGHASDAGILWHKDASGNETEILTLITDEGVKFYRQAGSNVPLYHDGREYAYGSGWGTQAYEAFFISSDEFATRTTNYGLYSISDSEYKSQRSSGIDGVSSQQDQVIQEKLNTGAGMDAFSIDSFTLLNDREIVAASINEGLFMVNFRSHLAVSLRSGAFYTAISYRKGGSERFMVVGFDTSEYYYQPMDIVRAKCYDMDLAAQNRERENQAMQGHLATLANNYLNRTHRSGIVEAENNGEIDEAEQTANAQARRLFFSSEASMQWELYQLVTGIGFGYTQRILDYTKELRQKLLTQREKLKEFYALCGLGNGSDLLDQQTGLPVTEELREQEGTLIHANYTSTLEHALVTLKLSEAAIAGMTSGQAEYREYRRQMQEAEAAQAELQDQQQNMYNDEFVQSKDVSKIDDSIAEDGLAYLENTDFYRAVLSDVMNTFEEQQYELPEEERVSWEDYMKGLLNAISPDNAVNQQERSFERFCQLAQIMTEEQAAALQSGAGGTEMAQAQIVTDEQMEELRNRIGSLDRVVDLELLIVEYKLKTAAYQSSPFRGTFEEFQQKSFDEETDRVKAFKEEGFYDVIRKLIDQAAEQKLLESTGGQEELETVWESELSDILSLCGVGIVLDPSTAEKFTEEESQSAAGG